MLPNQSYITEFRIYYEDTDAGGIVYYANYLKFAERARTEWLRSIGIEQSILQKNEGLAFVVRHVEADFLAPARLDDIIVMETCLQESGKVRMKIRQTIKRGKATLVDITVTIACINRNGKPVRLPAAIGKLEN